MNDILETYDLKKYYGEKPNITKALDGVSVSVAQGEFVSIIGTSGSGKSTLLNMLGGLDVPTAGSVKIRGKEIAEMNDEQLTVFRRRNIGFVFQNYNLVPILNVYQNIVLPIELDGNKVDKAYVDKIIQMLHLEEKLYNLPNNLSGGQQQRVAIAVALANEPAVLLADEPTGAVDTKTSDQIFRLFRKLNEELGLTIIIVTHDISLADKVNRVIMISDGNISTEKIRKDIAYTWNGEAEGVHEEYVILDRAHRLQLSEEVLEKAGISSNKVCVTVEDGKVMIVPQKE